MKNAVCYTIMFRRVIDHSVHGQIQEETAVKLLVCANCNKATDLDQNTPDFLSLDVDQQHFHLHCLIISIGKGFLKLVNVLPKAYSIYVFTFQSFFCANVTNSFIFCKNKVCNCWVLNDSPLICCCQNSACKASVTLLKKIIMFVIGWLEFLQYSVFSLQRIRVFIGSAKSSGICSLSFTSGWLLFLSP